MPELPEVETVVNSLRPFIEGKSFTHIKINHPKSFLPTHLCKYCLHTPVTSLHRHGKMIVFAFANDWYLLTHLKMTGQLIYAAPGQLAGGGHPSADVLKQLPGKHTRVIYTLNNGAHLFFNDQRIFGWQKVLTPAQLAAVYATTGPDANHPRVNTAYLSKHFSKTKRKIKQVLMDNKIMVGIGNIYAAEILFATRISPFMPANQLTSQQIAQLQQCMSKILSAAIAARGTTFDGRYVDALGQGGNYESQLVVYGRAGKTCPRCGSKIRVDKIGGRSSFWCPGCQQ